jgi:hypothetical protein
MAASSESEVQPERFKNEDLSSSRLEEISAVKVDSTR